MNVKSVPSASIRAVPDEPRKETPSADVSSSAPQCGQRPPTEIPFYQRPLSIARHRDRVLRQVTQFLTFKCSTSAPERERHASGETARPLPATAGKAPEAPRPFVETPEDYAKTLVRTSRKREKRKDAPETPSGVKERLNRLVQAERSVLAGRLPDQALPSAAMPPGKATEAVGAQGKRPGMKHYPQRFAKFVARKLKEASSGATAEERGFRLRHPGDSEARTRVEDTAAAIQSQFWALTLETALRGLNHGVENHQTIMECIDHLESRYQELAMMTDTQANGTSGPLRAMMTGLQNLNLINQGKYSAYGAPPSGLEGVSNRAGDLLNTVIRSTPTEVPLRLSQLGTTNAYLESPTIPGPKLPRQLGEAEKAIIKQAIADIVTLRDELQAVLSGLRDAPGQARAGASAASSDMQLPQQATAPSVRSDSEEQYIQLGDVGNNFRTEMLAELEKAMANYTLQNPKIGDGLFQYK